MHIHGISSSQVAAMLPTQATQQAQAEWRTAANVRRKLTAFAASGGEDAVTGVATHTPEGRGRRQDQPQEEEAFRNFFISYNA